MATKKTSTTRTTTATATKKGTKHMELKDIKPGTIITLKPRTIPETNKGFIVTPHKPKLYINAEGTIKTEYESIQKTPLIKEYTTNPVISNNYQTFWTTEDKQQLYQINVMPSAPTTAGKTCSPILFFLNDLLSQLNCSLDYNQVKTPEDILHLLDYIKSLNRTYTFIVTEVTGKTGNKYNVLKPVQLPVLKQTEDNYSL